jgi:hypothetical protein
MSRELFRLVGVWSGCWVVYLQTALKQKGVKQGLRVFFLRHCHDQHIKKGEMVEK